MGGAEIPVRLRVRAVIFARFNDTEARFTNDEILEAMTRDGADLTAEDIGPILDEMRDAGLVRSIAQNLNTVWFKLFGTMRESHCGPCGYDIHLGEHEEVCPNCGAGMGAPS